MIIKPENSTYELMERIKRNDSEAFEELFENLWEPLYRRAKTILLDEDIAKDVVQEVWVDFWQRRDEIVNDNIEAYLMQSTRFRVYKELKRSPLKKDHLTYLDTVECHSSTDDVVIFNQTEQMIHHSVDQLPNRCKQIFKMSREEQLSNAEIASQLNISKRTVETQISFAIKNLKLRLSSFVFGIMF